MGEEWEQTRVKVWGLISCKELINNKVPGVVWYKNLYFIQDQVRYPIWYQVSDQVTDQVIAEIKNDK